MSVVLDEVLRSEILCHVADNLGGQRHSATGGDLILAIIGAPGEGKSFHCKAVLGAAGVGIDRFHLDEFESAGAGVPPTRLIERYLAASEAVRDGKPTVLMIEDVDLGLAPDVEGRQGSELVQYTMNRDLIVGALMGLCDAPRAVRVPAESSRPDHGRVAHCERVPIIMTGNSSSRLYPALVRHGRTRLVRWSPSEATRTALVANAFPGLSAGHVGELLDEFDGQPASFWDSLKRDLRSAASRAVLTDRIGQDPDLAIREIIEMLSEIEPTEPTIEDIRIAGRRLIAARERHGTDG